MAKIEILTLAPAVSRAKLIQNMKTLLHERTDEERTVVYDLDQLIMEEKLLLNAENGNGPEDGEKKTTSGDQEPILRLFKLQLQRQRCSRLERFSK
jgi:hypothetical protein